jgi:hypothetical protein
MFEMTTVTDAALLVNAEIQPETEAPVLNTGATLPADLLAAFNADAPAATLATLTYAPTRKNERALTVLAAIGQSDEWTPVRTADATYTLRSVPKNKTQALQALQDGCKIRGGTILALDFGYKEGQYGFPVPNFTGLKNALDRAFFLLPESDRRRVDTDYRILANDQNAENVKDVAGYILVRIKGYRVK